MLVGKPQICRAHVLREPLQRGSVLGAHAEVMAWFATLEGVTVLRSLGLAWWCDGWRLVCGERADGMPG
ncbi:hypothetical protein TIFTF001_035453 [Ficus carica]|uniref:Uncharacterized protein n=1 Tax=Ficus carica TaxID=3494 RepID=A0AA88E3D0_FICCA|nr:hypothetical protein TIFTF001_035453 [Ficus carica]